MARTKKTKSGSALSDHAAVRGVRKGRSNQRRGARKQRIVSTLKRGLITVTAVAGLGASAFGAHQAWQWAGTSPYFALEAVQMKGAQRASQATLLRLAGVQVGDNLFKADAAAVHDAVAAHPWVDTVVVDKRYPRTLEIEVREHEPVVLVALGHLYYANAEGEIVKRYSPGEQESLPIVTGLSRTQIESDDPQAKHMLAEAVAFIDVWAHTLGDDAPKVAEVNVDPVMGLSFLLQEDSGRVLLGSRPWPHKIQRYQQVQQTLAARGVRASRITLSGTRRPERVVARLATRNPGSGRTQAPGRLNDGPAHGQAVAEAGHDTVSTGGE